MQLIYDSLDQSIASIKQSKKRDDDLNDIEGLLEKLDKRLKSIEDMCEQMTQRQQGNNVVINARGSLPWSIG